MFVYCIGIFSLCGFNCILSIFILHLYYFNTFFFFFKIFDRISCGEEVMQISLTYRGKTPTQI